MATTARQGQIGTFYFARLFVCSGYFVRVMLVVALFLPPCWLTAS